MSDCPLSAVCSGCLIIPSWGTVQAREDLARSVTAAILSHTGRQEHSALERLYLQLVRGSVMLCGLACLFPRGS